MSRTQLWFGGLSLACLLALMATALPAPFTIDDCNYLSTVAGLRHGTLFLPGTAELPPSRALYAFEPTAMSLRHPVSPVPPILPPLYALVAYPFSFAGLPGLILLNVLATLATVWLVFTAARRLTGRRWVGASAAVFWLFGASTIEYAQGVWPQMLTVALTTAGLVLVALAASHGRLLHAAVAGSLLALAAGMRYQNAVLLGSGFLILLVWGKPRWRACLALGLGALPLVVLSSLMNHARLGSYHPFAKTVGYLSIRAGRGTHGHSPVYDFFLTLWARVVDYSAQPPILGQAQSYLTKLPAGDMVTYWGVLKKSWLQASPWLAVAFIVLVLAWSRRDRFGEAAQRYLRMAALPIVAVLVTFGLAGVYRHDGLTFNQRYLLELAPLAAIAAAVGLSVVSPRWIWLAAGTVLGAAVAACVLLLATGSVRYRWQSLLPLIMAGAAAATWLVALAGRTGGRRSLLGADLGGRTSEPPRSSQIREGWRGAGGLAVALCLGYSLVIHVATDVPASQRSRHFNLGRQAILEEAVSPEHRVAIVAASGASDAFCPLLLERDLIVVAGNVVPAGELPPLIDALLAKRRVLLWLETFPKESLALLQARYHLTVLHPPMLAEIGK